MLYWMLGGGLVLLAAALMLAANYLIDAFIRRQPPLPPRDPATLSPFWLDYVTRNAAAIETLDALPHETLSLTSHDGLQLYARFFPLEGGGGGHDTVIVVHGYRGGIEDFAMMLPWYRAQGFNILIVDDRAHGKSEGNFAGFGALDCIDCAGWCRVIAERIPDRAIFLHGISMGAATVILAACSALPRQVRGAIADCSYTSAVEEFRHVMRTAMHIPGWVSALLMPLASLFCRLRAGYFFREAAPLSALPKTRLPFLFVHGTEDNYVPTEMVHRLYAACPTEKALLLVDGAPHAVSYAVDPQKYETAISAFYADKRTEDRP